MTNQTILYAIVIAFAAYIAWDKLSPHIKKVFSKKSASTQAMIDLAVAIQQLPSSTEAQCTKILTTTLTACDVMSSSTLNRCQAMSESSVEAIKTQAVEQSHATADLIVAIDKLTTALNGDESTKMLSGTLKACEAIAVATVELRDEIAAFGKIVRIDDKQYPADALIQPPDQKKDEQVASFLEALVRGRSVQDAQQQSKDDADTKTMFSAVTLDPTGGE